METSASSEAQAEAFRQREEQLLAELTESRDEAPPGMAVVWLIALACLCLVVLLAVAYFGWFLADDIVENETVVNFADDVRDDVHGASKSKSFLRIVFFQVS